MEELDQESNCAGSANESISPVSSGRKTPFRSFTPKSNQSIALLNAMLRNSPFDKANGPSVVERWQAVVDILIQLGERHVEGGGKNAYHNVIPRTCKLAWDRFKDDYNRTMGNRSPGPSDAEDNWNNLVRQVMDLEQAGKGRNKKQKKSAMIVEQDENEGAQLDETFAPRINRRHFSDADMSGNEELSAESEQHPSRRLRLDESNSFQEIQNQVSNFIQYAKEKLDDSSRQQHYRDRVLVETVASSQQQLLQAVHHLIAKQEAASERQAIAIEALASAILSRK
ncbi:hypothetical protein BGX27_006886 [Mortierella sp. AM989]|nr:hypothetical protein BGX27_006886 [Mortierella sp. AM989]